MGKKDNIIAVSLSDEAMEFLEAKKETEGHSFSRTTDMGVRMLRQMEREADKNYPIMLNKDAWRRKYHFSTLSAGQFFIVGEYTRKKMQSVCVSTRLYTKNHAPAAVFKVRKIGNELAVLRLK